LRVQSVASGFIVQGFEVCTRTKGAVRTVQNRHSGIRIGIEITKGIGQLLCGHAVDRVARRGTLNGHDGDRALARDLNFRCGHGEELRWDHSP
jgi:hypothetical protein